MNFDTIPYSEPTPAQRAAADRVRERLAASPELKPRLGDNRELIIAVDPGTELSAYIIAAITRGWSPTTQGWSERGIEILEHDILPNEDVRDLLQARGAFAHYERLSIEMVSSYGMPVGREVFETVLWTGRMIEAWRGNLYRKIYRKDVKLHLCGSSRAKDPNVRQAVLDRWPATGGGKIPQVGTKKNPGPLYGISSHTWAALAVAITAAETCGEWEVAK
jgi:hypothetical protein